MLGRYLKAQLTVLMFGGLVGPIFLAVYFALGPMARHTIDWMFWVGLVITAADVLAALALASAGAKATAKHAELTRTGILVAAKVTGISDTAWFVNDQQVIKVTLHFEVPGQPGFDAQETMPASPTRMQILNAHQLVALVEPGTQNYEIDWNASGLLAGVVPAEFTVEEDHTTYDLTGRSAPLLQILNVLHVNGIPAGGTMDMRSNPVVRRQIVDIVRRAAAQTGGPAPVPPPTPVLPAPLLPPPTVSQRLQELETLRATGAVTEAEYTAKRQQILADL